VCARLERARQLDVERGHAFDRGRLHVTHDRRPLVPAPVAAAVEVDDHLERRIDMVRVAVQRYHRRGVVPGDAQRLDTGRDARGAHRRECVSGIVGSVDIAAQGAAEREQGLVGDRVFAPVDRRPYAFDAELGRELVQRRHRVTGSGPRGPSSRGGASRFSVEFAPSSAARPRIGMPIQSGRCSSS
jgi:hypothetical protein